MTINKFLMILFLVVCLSLSGCSSKTTITEEKADISDEQNNSSDEAEKIIEDITESAREDIPENVISKEEPSSEKAPNGAPSEPIKAVETTPEPVQVVQEPEKAEENTLKVQGDVTNELSLAFDQLKGMKEIIFEDDFYSLNTFGTKAHTRFKGINLWSLLEQKAQISSNASKVTIIATDGYKMEFTIDQVKKQDYIDETNADKKFPMIIAWEEKGQEYDPADGPPYKLIVGQREAGDVNKPQWVSNIDRIIIE